MATKGFQELAREILRLWTHVRRQGELPESRIPEAYKTGSDLEASAPKHFRILVGSMSSFGRGGKKDKKNPTTLPEDSLEDDPKFKPRSGRDRPIKKNSKYFGSSSQSFSSPIVASPSSSSGEDSYPEEPEESTSSSYDYEGFDRHEQEVSFALDELKFQISLLQTNCDGSQEHSGKPGEYGGMCIAPILEKLPILQPDIFCQCEYCKVLPSSSSSASEPEEDLQSTQELPEELIEEAPLSIEAKVNPDLHCDSDLELLGEPDPPSAPVETKEEKVDTTLELPSSSSSSDSMADFQPIKPISGVSCFRKTPRPPRKHFCKLNISKVPSLKDRKKSSSSSSCY